MRDEYGRHSFPDGEPVSINVKFTPSVESKIYRTIAYICLCFMVAVCILIASVCKIGE